MKNIKISLVVITKNEERNIANCINSVKDVVDEIIVIDSFSSDSTKNICEQLGANFISKIWEGYSAAKNYGNSIANGEYILSLDADEVLSDDLKSYILSEKNEFQFDAYYFNRKTNYCGQWINHSGWYPDPKLRLWKKDNVYWQGDIHEKIILPDNYRINFVKLDILHYSFNSISEHVSQLNRFSDIHALSAFEKGRKTNVIKIFIKPIERFLTTYFFKLGFLDGFYGFIICQLSAQAIFLRNIKLYQLNRKNKKAYEK